MWFLIGSQAIKTITKDFYRDISLSDIDIYCSKDDFKDLLINEKKIEKCFPIKKNKYRLKITNYPIIELKIYEENSVYDWLSKKEQKQLLSDKVYYINDLSLNIPNLQCLRAVKQAHIYWPIHWLKNINDLTWLNTQCTKNTYQENQFKRKIKNEMKNIHGKIPHGNFTDSHWKEIIKNIPMDMSYEKNIINFIHFKLTVKNKLKVIQQWSTMQYYKDYVEKNTYQKKTIS